MKLEPYPEYKDSGVEWIGNLPSNWDLVRNKNIFSKSKNIVGDKWEDYPVLSLTKKGVIIRDIESNEGKMPSDFSIYQIVRPSNLLLCLFDIDVTPRCVGYINNKGIVSAAYSEISPTTDIYTKYYYYWYLMLDFDKQLLHLSKNLRNSLSNEDFMALPIVKPSINEQKQISFFLDKKTSKIDLTIEKDTRLIELLKEKRTALINHVVTKGLDPTAEMKDSGVEWIGEIPEDWEVSKIKHVSKRILTGKTPPSDREEYYDNEDLNWFTPGDLGNNLVLIKSSKRISNLCTLDNKIIKYKPFSVLLVGIGATLGKVGLSTEEGTSNQQINAIEFYQNKINAKFGLYYLYGMKNLIISLSNSSTIGIFNQTQTGNFIILNPPLNEQKQIVKKLDNETSKIDLTIQKIQENIELLEEYKKSLIHHVVTGKVDVREVAV